MIYFSLIQLALTARKRSRRTTITITAEPATTTGSALHPKISNTWKKFYTILSMRSSSRIAVQRSVIELVHAASEIPIRRSGNFGIGIGCKCRGKSLLKHPPIQFHSIP